MTRLVMVAALLWGSLASAQTIYRWVDAQGTTHYTDNLASIPKSAKVTTTDGDDINTITNETPEPEAPAPARATAAPAAPPDGWSDQERQWRAWFRAARDNIRTLEDEIALDQKKVDDPSQLPVTSSYQCGGYGVPLPPTPYATTTASATAGVPGRGHAGHGNSVVVTGTGQVARPPLVQQPPTGTFYGNGYGTCWHPVNAELQMIRDRLERNQLALKRAKEDFSDLERRAANASVPFEWRR